MLEVITAKVLEEDNEYYPKRADLSRGI